MSKIVFSNFAYATLAAPLGLSDVSMTVASGTGSLFPSPTGGDYAVLVLLDEATKEIREVIWVTARSGDTMTIQRAKEGTTAKVWLVGDICQLATTAGTLGAMQQADDVTAAINAVLQNVIFPVGSFFSNGATVTDPGDLSTGILKFGTWTAVNGRAVVGYQSGDPDFGTLLATGGAKTHTLTIPETPTHAHILEINGGTTNRQIAGNGTGPIVNGRAISDGAVGDNPALEMSDVGDGNPHNNLQPYIVAAVWRRTA